MARTLTPLLLATTLRLTGPASAGERRVVSLPGTDLGLPFSPGVVAGDRLYLSGNTVATR